MNAKERNELARLVNEYGPRLVLNELARVFLEQLPLEKARDEDRIGERQNWTWAARFVTRAADSEPVRRLQ